MSLKLASHDSAELGVHTDRSVDPVFPVRFTKATGPTAFFAFPQNSFRWVGSGRVRVGSNALHMNGRRYVWPGFCLPQYRVVPKTNIYAVYREGAAVRLDIRSATTEPNYHLQFWLESTHAAATLVAQLPTPQTVEVEALDRPAERATAANRSAVGLYVSLFGVLSLLLAAWLLNRLISPNIAQPRTEHKSVSVSASSSVENRTQARASDILAAKTDWNRFGTRIEALTSEFSVAFAALQDGTLSQEDFAQGLEKWLDPQWKSLELRLRESTRDDGPVSVEVRKNLMAAVVNWQRALKAYAAGLRAHDSAMVLKAFDYLREAEGDLREAGLILEHSEGSKGE
jgi:hypothetical protein